MLSLVLGSSTHAFELMLSAFILGLALGGFFIRRLLRPPYRFTVITVSLISLGCAKNLVDSEIMIGHLHQAGMKVIPDAAKADVVVVNPTHVAVALKYDLDESPAPMVLAMGERLLAQRIKELARKHDVPIVENTPVARALLASAQVGSPIPPALYAAIAEILAFVYRQRGRLPGGGRLTLDGGRS